MSDREKALAALTPREDKIELGGVTFVLREIDSAADLAALRDGEDTAWKILVRSCFGESGEPLFTDADIPALKRGALARNRKLVEAAQRVNRELLDPDVKPSADAPAGG